MDYSFNTSLGLISHTVSKLLGERFMEFTKDAGLNISANEWFLLSLLFYKKECTQYELKESMNLHKVRITRLVDSLDKKGWIVRDVLNDDKRYRSVRLNEAGRRVYYRVEPIAAQILELAFSGFSKSEYLQLMALCNRVLYNLKND